MSDFQEQFGEITEPLVKAARGLMNGIDHMLYKALIACLKSDDAKAAIIAIEQLEKEAQPVSVAPLYFVMKAHPVPAVQERARTALSAFKQDEKIKQLTSGKELKDAIKALVEEYGNYKEN